jgi:hypothetical protein
VGKDTKIRASFDFLRERARSEDKSFTLSELSTASKWTEKTARAYISKHLSEFVLKGKQINSYEVNTRIIDVQYFDYVSLFKQSDVLAPNYHEHRYSDVVVYELFLPLTCEDKLRRALEKLFYKDIVIDRFKSIGFDELKNVFEKNIGKNNQEYLEELATFISQRFGGYSISHVSGRFRSDELSTKMRAREIEDAGGSYLIDETTAVVRFIIPLHATEEIVSASTQVSQMPLKLNVEQELKQVEWSFRAIFVSAILNTVGQEEIWVLESGKRNQLIRFVAVGKNS